MLDRWLSHPAEWWQFWYPQSGAAGGAISGGVLLTVVLIMLFWGA